MLICKTNMFPVTKRKRLRLLFAGGRVRAGFPSPADDYQDASLDLNEQLVKNPAATFIVRVAGESMLGAGISPGDMLVVDKSLDARDGNIVVATVNGEFTLKRYRIVRGFPELMAENPDFPPIRLSEGDEACVWGVVKHVIKDV